MSNFSKNLEITAKIIKKEGGQYQNYGKMLTKQLNLNIAKKKFMKNTL